MQHIFHPIFIRSPEVMAHVIISHHLSVFHHKLIFNFFYFLFEIHWTKFVYLLFLNDVIILKANGLFPQVLQVIIANFPGQDLCFLAPKTLKTIWLPNLLTLNLPDENDSINTPSTFLLYVRKMMFQMVVGVLSYVYVSRLKLTPYNYVKIDRIRVKYDF